MNKSVWIKRSKEWKPTLHHRAMTPLGMVQPVADDSAFQGWRMETAAHPAPDKLNNNDVRCWDFGEHLVGTLSFLAGLAGNRQDSPVKLRIVFGEMPCELALPMADYDGFISKAWLQEEILILDRLPARVNLPRRYAFRYLKIEVVAASPRFGVYVGSITCDAVTSADENHLLPQPPLPEGFSDIYTVCVRTLRDCMQYVFEDGPKRDRRLWLGDLRLEALACYTTYNQHDLIKRCLCMFAAAVLPNGKMPASVYDADPPADDECCLTDYALLFVSTLWDYCNHTGDLAFVREIYPYAARQLRLAAKDLDENGLMTYQEGFTCFIDWSFALDKHTALQGVYLYCLEHGIKLAQALHIPQDAAAFETLRNNAKRAALAHCWDEERGRFVSGKERQVSWASQIWMVLANVLNDEKASALMLDVIASPPQAGMVTPYLKHYLIEALFSLGMREQVMEAIREYWGKMITLGADTFWEIFMPDDPERSPYGSCIIHSYCHAWSCTPVYFLYKAFCD